MKQKRYVNEKKKRRVTHDIWPKNEREEKLFGEIVCWERRPPVVEKERKKNHQMFVFCIADCQMRNVNVRSVNSKRRKTPSSSCLWVSQFRCSFINSNKQLYQTLLTFTYYQLYYYDIVVITRYDVYIFLILMDTSNPTSVLVYLPI